MGDIQQDIKDGERCKNLRKMMKMKQVELAERLNIEQSNLSHMERGRQPISRFIPTIEYLFAEWRKKEISLLRKRIAYLESVI